MLNERILPNPFKQDGADLSNVLTEIERELDDYNHAPLPTFLNDAFLLKLESEVMAASVKDTALKAQAMSIIRKLHFHWPRS